MMYICLWFNLGPVLEEWVTERFGENQIWNFRWCTIGVGSCLTYTPLPKSHAKARTLSTFSKFPQICLSFFLIQKTADSFNYWNHHTYKNTRWPIITLDLSLWSSLLKSFSSFHIWFANVANPPKAKHIVKGQWDLL